MQLTMDSLILQESTVKPIRFQLKVDLLASDWRVWENITSKNKAILSVTQVNTGIYTPKKELEALRDSWKKTRFLFLFADEVYREFLLWQQHPCIL